MHLNHDSLYKKLAKKTVKWLTSDTEEQYKSHLVTKYDQLKKYGWIERSEFDYKFNEYGFRCDNFSEEPTIMFLGCSNTIGIGVPENDRWSNIVSRNLNLKCANLGIGGSSLDTAFRMCHGWIDKINPKLVILRKPPGTRFELVTSVNQQHISAWKGTNDTFYKVWSIDDNNAEFNSMKNIMAIQYMCDERKIKLVVAESFYRNFPEFDLARDLIHAGSKSNKCFADKVLSLI